MNLKEKILSYKIILKAINKAKRVSFPGFGGVAIYDVLILFFEAINDGVIAQKAAAISFNFFLALFPLVLFFFTLIPIIPINGFQTELMKLIMEVMPGSTNESVLEILNEIITRPNRGVLSIGFILALIFSTNGFKSIIIAFNSSVHIKNLRTFFNLQITSLVLVIIFSVSTTITIGAFIMEDFVLDYLILHGFLVQGAAYYLLLFGDWILKIGMIFFMISFLYYYAPNYNKRFRLISTGSTFSTIIIVIVSVLFNLYLTNFSRYNILYGSIGTLIIVLMWIYINSFILLIGFEINSSIVAAHQKKNTNNNISKAEEIERMLEDDKNNNNIETHLDQ